MKKRLICLLLCLVMAVGCFVGCSKESDDEAIDNVNKEASESAMTLAMYLLCEEELSTEQALAIETAVNKITKPKFKTQLKLYFYTADKYYEALEASFAARKEAEELGQIVDREPDEEAVEETFENEWGISEIKYPTIDGFQVDIFYVSGYEKFSEYLADERLERLDDDLSSSSKILSDYISPEFLSYMKSLNNGTYAIPTNTAIGKYQYLLLNKEVLEKTRYNTDAGLKQFTGLTSDAVKSVLAQVKSEYTDYVPLYSCLGPDGIAVSDYKFWGVDENGVLCSDFSVLASQCPKAEYNTPESFMGSSLGNILSQKKFTDAVKDLKYYKQQNYFGTEQDLIDGKVAVAYMEGGADIAAKYSENYVPVVVGTPTLETEDLYENMFAVSSYTTSLSRSMEIITYLNTNEDFRNLLLYGVEGVNYELVNSDYTDADGNFYKVVRRLNNSYMMDVYKTGNTLLAYTLEGDDPTVNEYIKDQNSDVKISLTMGFKIKTETYVVSPEWFAGLRTLSDTVYKRLQAASYEEIDAVIEELKNTVALDTNMVSLMTERGSDNGGDPEGTVVGLAYLYEQWAIGMKIYDPEAAA